MPNILNAAKTMRNLIQAPAGYASWGSGTRQISFGDGAGGAVPLDFKPGETIYCDNPIALCTIQGGSGALWIVDQPFVNSGSNVVNWYRSDPSASKARGSANAPNANPIGGLLVPDAVHYIYLSPVDDAGDPDYYVYVDTTQPERGVHPYTRDAAIGSFKTVPRTLQTGRTGRPIMDLGTRVRDLEGAVRAGRSAGSSVQDDRVAKLVARLVAFETWANSGGHFGTPPAVGSSTVYTEDNFIKEGD